LNWAEIRSHFPALAGTVYVNTAGGGPMCREAWEAARGYLDAFYERGDTEWDYWLQRVEEVRGQLAGFLGARPAQVAFLANASSGLNLVADIFEGDGDVLALADDFPSVTLPWLVRGRNLRFVESRANGVVPLDAIVEALGPSVRVLAASLVQYRTGFRLDLGAVSRLCRDRGVRLVVDATQAFGTIPIDLGATPVDALVFSAYKWATAGYGIAPLLLSAELLEERPLPSAGWRSAREPYALEATRLELTREARGLELGHPPFAGIVALGGALELFESIGLLAIEERIRELTDQLHRGLDALGRTILSPREPGQRAGITLVASDEPAQTARELRERGVLVSARGNGIRISMHFYNDEGDVQSLLRALRELP
jgi:selenocysteine lyase/cysteine desulfurase